MTSERPARRPPPTLTLGRVRGVPIVVSPSWLLVGLLLTVVYGPLLDDAVTDISASTAYLSAFGFSVVFALCVLAHELGHTLVSISLGYPVKRVVLFVLGGVSEIEGEPTRARDELLISAAGPAVSVLIAVLGFAGYGAVDASSLVGVLLFLLAWSNVVLAVFNLLPGLPLDGGRLLRAACWGCGVANATSTRIAAGSGRVLALLIAGFGLWAARGADTIATSALTLLLAGYLWVSASQSLRAARLLGRLPQVRVDGLLRPGLLVTGDVSVAEALRRVRESNARGLVVVDSDRRPAAIVDEAMFGAVTPERRAWTPVSSVARPLDDGLTLPAGMTATELLAHIQDNPAREYLVLAADGSPAGIITTADFARRLKE